MKLLIIIPAYNEELSIVSVISELQIQCPFYDYLIVNDGSRDNTANICRDMRFHFLDLPVNVGLAGAVQAGMQYASKNGYDMVLQFDGDGQHIPKYISFLCESMKKDDSVSVVIGSRFVANKKSFNSRMIGSRMISLLIRLVTGVRITDPTSGMRLYGKKIINEFAWNLNYDPEPDTLVYLIRNGIKVIEEPVEMREREHGESYLHFTRALRYMLRISVSILFIQWFRKRRKTG